MIDHCIKMRRHYGKTWQKYLEKVGPAPGPLVTVEPNFEILKFKRTGDTYAYGTCLLSGTQDPKLELSVIMADDVHEDSIVEVLTVIAYFNLTGGDLGLGHTINLGQPWVPGGTCTRALISLPYLDGPELEWTTDHATRCLWLIPLTESEVQYKSIHGLEALESLLEEREFNYLDMHRPSVV